MRDRWKRILSAGAAVGAGLTFVAHPLAARADEPDAKAPGGTTAEGDASAPDRAGAIEATPEWRRLEETLGEAEAISSGARGDYPFDRAGREALLARVDTLPIDVDVLAGRNLLDAAAADLLKRRIADLKRGVESKRPTEMEFATCYKPRLFDPVGDSLRRLGERLPSIERLAAEGRLAPAVVERILAGIEADVETLAGEGAFARLGEVERTRGAGIRDRVKAAVARIRSTAGTAPAPNPR